jgi:hypothetical protein
LLADYLLTAAVSLTAGVEALASAFPALWHYRVAASLVILVVITLVNLRGLRETGTLMAVPVYFFLVTYFAMLAYGMVPLAIDGPTSWTATAPPALQPVTLFLLLHAFSTGSTALTGIEAISNGVPTFKPPTARNAGRTLVVMAVLMAVLFLGSIGLTQSFGVVASSQETILSALAHRILGNGLPYFTVQVATMLILAVAANTSFAGYPQLGAILARDGYLPRQLTSRGDRLVYANGIIALALGTAALIVVFRGDSHALIPLFAVGVFLAFTLSQAGMVVHWRRERQAGWQVKALINGLGAMATAVTFLVVGASKFLDGAWIVLAAIPLMVLVFLRIKSHYGEVRRQLAMNPMLVTLRPVPLPRIVIPISGVQRSVAEAVAFARGIAQDVTAVYVELEPGSGERVAADWQRWWPDIPLVIVPSPYRSLVRPLLDFLDETDRQHNDGQLAAIVLPELVPAKWWQSLLHNQTAWLIKAALLYRRRRHGYQRVIIDVPFHMRR